MAMGSKDDEQAGLFLTYKDVPRSAGHPFYQALEAILRENGFDRFVERECEPYYAESGRPSLPPGVYFRCLLVGYFEGIDSERGIAWRIADSLSLREFLGLGLDQGAARPLDDLAEPATPRSSRSTTASSPGC